MIVACASHQEIGALPPLTRSLDLLNSARSLPVPVRTRNSTANPACEPGIVNTRTSNDALGVGGDSLSLSVAVFIRCPTTLAARDNNHDRYVVATIGASPTRLPPATGLRQSRVQDKLVADSQLPVTVVPQRTKDPNVERS